MEASGELQCAGVGDSTREKYDLKNLTQFVPSYLLKEDFGKKEVCAVGTLADSKDRALIIFEQNPFAEETVKHFCSTESVLKEKVINDIYGNYECFPERKLCGIKTTLIHPATDDDINKCKSQQNFIIAETPEFYEDVTLPIVSHASTNLQWVYNILDNKEKTKILLEDGDPKTGFVLTPHILWNEADAEQLHAVAIVRPRGIKSLRDLTSQHIPLLKNVHDKTLKYIEENYSTLLRSRITVFLHYQPSYYHLHIHFASMRNEDAGTNTEEAHLLTEVINNLELIPDYYQKATLPFIFNRFSLWYTQQEKIRIENLLKEDNSEQQ